MRCMPPARGNLGGVPFFLLLYPWNIDLYSNNLHSAKLTHNVAGALGRHPLYFLH